MTTRERLQVLQQFGRLLIFPVGRYCFGLPTYGRIPLWLPDADLEHPMAIIVAETPSGWYFARSGSLPGNWPRSIVSSQVVRDALRIVVALDDDAAMEIHMNNASKPATNPLARTPLTPEQTALVKAFSDFLKGAEAKGDITLIGRILDRVSERLSEGRLPFWAAMRGVHEVTRSVLKIAVDTPERTAECQPLLDRCCLILQTAAAEWGAK